MPNKCVCHICLPGVAVGFLMYVFVSTFFGVIVVEPENIFTHTNNIRKDFRTLMISQARIDGIPDES
jgi:ABC-type Mn2+/Zn2+ transport system permease subunit